MTPQTRYARNGDVSLAYQVVAEEGPPLVFIGGFFSHIEHLWEEPGIARFFERLASFSRFVLWDRRGSGLSDRALSDATLSAEVGDLDLHTAPELREVLGRAIDEGRSRIVVDLTETSYMDSSGLTALVVAHKRLRSRDGQLVVVNVDPSIGRTFEITGLHLLFPLVRERSEALARLQD